MEGNSTPVEVKQEEEEPESYIDFIARCQEMEFVEVTDELYNKLSENPIEICESLGLNESVGKSIKVEKISQTESEDGIVGKSVKVEKTFQTESEERFVGKSIKVEKTSQTESEDSIVGKSVKVETTSETESEDIKSKALLKQDLEQKADGENISHCFKASQHVNIPSESHAPTAISEPVQGFSSPGVNKFQRLQLLISKLETSLQGTRKKKSLYNNENKFREKRNSLKALSVSEIQEATIKRGKNMKLLCNCIRRQVNKNIRLTCENVTNVKHRRNCRFMNLDSVCKICAKVCSTTFNLRRHMITHSDDYYHCDKCDFKTLHEANLERHARIHSKEYPHKCDMCGYKCVQASSLVRHVRSRHSKVKPFKCHHCSYKCVRKDMLNNHIKIHHLSDQS